MLLSHKVLARKREFVKMVGLLPKWHLAPSVSTLLKFGFHYEKRSCLVFQFPLTTEQNVTELHPVMCNLCNQM